MRLYRVPGSIKQLPRDEREQALQSAVNGVLHSRGICPVSEYVAGPRRPTVGVYHESGHWVVETAWRETEHLLPLVRDEIEKQARQEERRT